MEMHIVCDGRQSIACDRVFWGFRAVVEAVVYLEMEGGADISNSET